MELTISTPFQQALDVVERLPLEDQETLVDIIRRRLIEQRRAEIARNAQATRQAFQEGRASYGTVDDLRRDLLDKPFTR
jgi:hypothetical protein